jgi:hypothetical protein
VAKTLRSRCLETDSIVMRSLHDVHEMNAYGAGYVCLFVRPSARMIQLRNRWTDLDEIWYGRHAIGDYPKIVLLNFLQSVIPTWRTNELQFTWRLVTGT